MQFFLKVTVEGGVESVQGVKKKVREALGGEGVAYVDTRVGAPEAWIRSFYLKGFGTKLTLKQISGVWTRSKPGGLSGQGRGSWWRGWRRSSTGPRSRRTGRRREAGRWLCPK